MKIIFLSGGNRAPALEYIVQKGLQVVAVITPIVSENNKRFLPVIEAAHSFGIPVHQVGKGELVDVVNKLDFDILVSCGYTQKIEKKILDLCKYAINVHPTLLPKYRGFRSGPFILINGEVQSGVTVHFLTDEMDKGDIILQKAYEVSPFDTNKSLYRKNQLIEPDLLYEALIQLMSGNVNSRPQNEEDATLYEQIRTPKDSFIDWNKPLKELYNDIRACDPEDYPAFFYVEDQKVCIKLWRPHKPTDESDMI